MTFFSGDVVQPGRVVATTNIRIREAKFHMSSLAVLLQVEVVPERETLTTTPSSSTRIHLFLTKSVCPSGSRILYSTSYGWTSKSMDQWAIEYATVNLKIRVFFWFVCSKNCNYLLTVQNPKN